MMQLIYWDGKPGTLQGLDPDEHLVVDCDNGRPMPGWYWVADLFEGLSDPVGPFASRSDAEAYKARGGGLCGQ
jgi:hypothetical protein